MEREIKFAKYLTEDKIKTFLEGTGCVHINKNKKLHIKVGKHEIIVVGGALIEKYQPEEKRGTSPVYKELNFMCILNDFQCKLTIAGNSIMSQNRKLLFKRKYAEFLLSCLPEDLKEKFVHEYNTHIKEVVKSAVPQE